MFKAGDIVVRTDDRTRSMPLGTIVKILAYTSNWESSLIPKYSDNTKITHPIFHQFQAKYFTLLEDYDANS